MLRSLFLLIVYVSCLPNNIFGIHLEKISGSMFNHPIKQDYICRTTYTHQDGRGWQDQAQDEVYFTAYEKVQDKPEGLIADVIEHLVDPDILLNWIQSCDFDFLVISTPDRDILPFVQEGMYSQVGPPINPAHVREWSFDEFKHYISHYFDVIEHFHPRKKFWRQILIAKKRVTHSPSQVSKNSLGNYESS